MSATEARHLQSEADMDRAVEAMAKAIAEDLNGARDVILVGIRTRGVPLAEWLARKLEAVTGRKVPVGSLDINLYRDDLSEVDHQPVVRQTELPTPIEGKGIILVDDVLFTGRTIRAAMDALVDFGRPQFVRLAVMIDRGFRELPIQADYVGKKVKTALQENVKVMFKSTDGINQVLVKRQQ
ncbi:MAG: bifunctional pyr operon transcriptional regulator/uracil phosphoribosyltransferase PyrR [Deltaproteobacteria bacterium]|nr:bifunctional pyr operon transcriptional regulator/uracil phosphoribosyltransferase PyrR [Deltaproteobacteria bacterium]